MAGEPDARALQRHRRPPVPRLLAEEIAQLDAARGVDGKPRLVRGRGRHRRQQQDAHHAGLLARWPPTAMNAAEATMITAPTILGIAGFSLNTRIPHSAANTTAVYWSVVALATGASCRPRVRRTCEANVA